MEQMLALKAEKQQRHGSQLILTVATVVLREAGACTMSDSATPIHGKFAYQQVRQDKSELRQANRQKEGRA